MPLLLGRLLHVLEEGQVAALVLHFQGSLGALTLLLGRFAGKVAHALQRHNASLEIEAQREVGVGGLRVHVDQAVEDSLHLGGVILRSPGAPG